MIFKARLSLFVYAIALIAGGAMGYVKAGSPASLIAGSVSGVLALVSFVVSWKRPRAGFALGLAVALAVGLERLKGYLDAPAEQPKPIALAVAVMSFVMAATLILGLVTRQKKN